MKQVTIQKIGSCILGTLLLAATSFTGLRSAHSHDVSQEIYQNGRTIILPVPHEHRGEYRGGPAVGLFQRRDVSNRFWSHAVPRVYVHTNHDRNFGLRYSGARLIGGNSHPDFTLGWGGKKQHYNRRDFSSKRVGAFSINTRKPSGHHHH